jgi:glycosidase
MKNPNVNSNTKEFHISRAAREKYQVDDSLFSLRGTIVLANFYAARLLAQKINAARGVAGAVQAGELNALGLIHEILHYVLQQYRRQRGDVMAQAAAALYEQVGADAVETTLRKFVDEFPPLPVYRGEQTVLEYLNGRSDGIPNRETVIEEMLLVWLENQNPAASSFKELFDDTPLAQTTAYPRIISSLREFFARQEPLGAGQTLIEALRAPFLHAPESLGAQLDYMLYRWSAIAGRFDVAHFFSRILGGLQLIQEEQKFLWTQAHRGGGGFVATTPPVPVFRRELQKRVDETGKEIWFEPEPEQFSPDLDWMPNLVLLAKSTYVWLDQLSKNYQREIKRLDQIPDEELDELRARGITGLWFIGVWERSQASAKIKHLLGNTGAMASAYSLYDYEIARELGGTDALENLKARAWRRGIRIASDMVPNHMGIDSRWVIEHPDWFIQSRVPPYPSYSFHSPDLSSDPRVTIQIEDHYFDKTDAAVVFKRYDHQTGDTRYIYHGNDGTSFPWNDTAQLNYLLPQVREAVIQTILHVARLTPVIRFDAAMTLAKKHYQRLWYPTPGEQNTIPSRGEYSMTKEQFDAAMPEEFWREVVDRVAAEAPDTLLLAEAFWLMEGYFVRTLGMHRVYNSAFMHMLRDEKNLEYRLVIKNTIEFDPEVLKRYVNFMNNPDERTAVDQFGKGDKYFGVCVMMATMPGLPMFGHGQIEGFTERYGMEFRTAMLDETPDHWLVERHQREIFPLLHKRYLFAGVENFLLYDVYRPDGTVDENVFAYSNRVGNQAALVVYNNAYTEARGGIRVSAAFRDKARDNLVQRTLADGLHVRDVENSFVIFRDAISGNEWIRSARELIQQGFDIALGAYKYAVYLDFRQVTDTPDGQYANLYHRLRGRGVPSVEQAIRDIKLAPLHAAFRELVNEERIKGNGETGKPEARESENRETRDKALALAQVVKEYGVEHVDENAFADQVVRNLEHAHQLNDYPLPKRAAKKLQAAWTDLQTHRDVAARAGLAALAIVDALETLAPDARGTQVVAWMDEWELGRVLGEALRGAGVDEARTMQIVSLIRMALEHPGLETGDALFANPDTARFLHVNQFNEILWFNREAFDALLNWYALVGAWKILRTAKTQKEASAALVQQYALWQALRDAEAQSEYQVEKFLAALPPPKARTARAQTTTARKTKTAARKKAAVPKTKTPTRRARKGKTG